MPSPANKLAPEVTGVNRLVDFIAQRLPAHRFPTNARTLLETAQGVRSPITENNFLPEELNALRELIMLKGGDAGNIQYEDYRKLGKPVTLITPLGNVQTTLGRFRYARDVNGNLIIQDTYDFNPPQEGAVQEQRTSDYGALGPYGLIRDYAGQKIPPGYGRPVNINLGR
jgi:hypothetical protein